MLVLFAGAQAQALHEGWRMKARRVLRRHEVGDRRLAMKLAVSARKLEVHDQVLEAQRSEPLSGAAAEELLDRALAEIDPELDSYRDEARELMRRRWPEVKAVARALVERGELTGAEVTEIIERAEARRELRP